ncbi:PHP domain-containing protein [Methanothermobacter sp. KEPCO 2]|uniref:PHP domain-containing protein n=1 Tax=Methanothermobacter sp. KEPCO 2 TaxID=3240977 RepID=UPI003517026D
MIRIDPHIHTVYSGDARGTPRDVLKRASLVGLDAVAIADHNTMKGSLIAMEDSAEFGVTVVPAVELSTSAGHIVALGVQEEIQRGLTPAETLDEIHSQDALAIIPHPFVRYRQGLFVNERNLRVDAVETLNSRYIVGYSNWRARKFARKRGIPEIGASDAHFVEAVGSSFTFVESENTADDIIEGIRRGRTRPEGRRTPLPLIVREVINKKLIGRMRNDI